MWTAALARMRETVRDTFPAAVAYTYRGGGTVAIAAIFDEAAEVQEMQDGVVVSATRPMLTVNDSDLTRAPKARDSVVIGGTSYNVTDAQPDGSGMTRCYLERA